MYRTFFKMRFSRSSLLSTSTIFDHFPDFMKGGYMYGPFLIFQTKIAKYTHTMYLWTLKETMKMDSNSFCFCFDSCKLWWKLGVCVRIRTGKKTLCFLHFSHHFSHLDTRCKRGQRLLYITKGLVHPNENSVIIYSPSCCSKPVRPSSSEHKWRYVWWNPRTRSGDWHGREEIVD